MSLLIGYEVVGRRDEALLVSLTWRVSIVRGQPLLVQGAEEAEVEFVPVSDSIERTDQRVFPSSEALDAFLKNAGLRW